MEKRRIKNIILIFIGCFIMLFLYLVSNKFTANKIATMYIASATNEAKLFSLKKVSNQESANVLVEAHSIPRGKSYNIDLNNYLSYQDEKYYQIIVDDNEYYVSINNLVDDSGEVVLEKNIYVQTPSHLLTSIGEAKILKLLEKGEELKVLNYNKLDEFGDVNIYTVEVDGIEGIIYGKYISYSKEEALLNYKADIYDPIHNKIKNSYGGGEAIDLDFYPNEKVEFENNKMPENVYALYLNCSKDTISNIDAYIEFAKKTKINTFVVDIKDNQVPAYPAEVFKSLSPTNYKHAINSYESYKKAISKLKEANFYVVGRITVFKDSYYVKDHPETAITNKKTNKPYLHNGSYWPSAYNRDVWYFNVALAKEAIKEFGFNEINFDYVRFPDRMNSVINIVDLKNAYNESKVQAIQRFVSYARDALHEENTYISIDVFGETTNGTYTTAYGQYWPAISNVTDVICGMPYPDHFAKGSYGLSEPWNEPYKLMNYWGRYAQDRQREIPTPAKVRTWIQAYDVMSHVDKNGIKYDAKQIEEQIRGLYDANITDGYITWLANSDLKRYKKLADAFNIDYGKEYKDD